MASALSGHDVCADGRGESWAALLPAKGAAAAVVSQCAAGAAHKAVAEEDGESSEVSDGKPEPRDREPNAGVEEAA